MVVEEWISLREFSRRRDVALYAVQKAIESGRVTAVRRLDEQDPTSRITSIEFHLATLQWNAHTDPAQAARSGKTLSAPGEQLELPDKGAPGKTDDPATKGERDPDGYYGERAKREKYAAAQAELDYLQAIGRLVAVDEIRKVSARRYRGMRDKLLNIPDRVAAILAAEKDPARVHAALTVELKRVLSELSDDAGAEVAGGIAERVAA